jgi:hypothetical protein
MSNLQHTGVVSGAPDPRLEPKCSACVHYAYQITLITDLVACKLFCALVFTLCCVQSYLQHRAVPT